MAWHGMIMIMSDCLPSVFALAAYSSTTITTSTTAGLLVAAAVLLPAPFSRSVGSVSDHIANRVFCAGY